MSDEQKNNGVDDSMDEILASIRETVESEVAKTSSAENAPADAESDTSAENLSNDILNDVLAETNQEEPDDGDVNIDDILAAATNSADAPAPTEAVDDDDIDIDAMIAGEAGGDAKADEEDDDDILELTDMLPAEEGTDVIDVDAFSNDGSIQEANQETVDTAKEEYNEIDVDIDSIVDSAAETTEEPEAEVETVTEAPEAEAEVIVDTNDEADAENTTAEELQEENPETDNGEDDKDMTATAEKIITEDEVIEETQAQAETLADKVVPMVASAMAETAERKVHLRTQPSATGLSVSFPSEVLAEALRPLVTDWIEENLSDIVERLVREELSKLADK